MTLVSPGRAPAASASWYSRIAATRFAGERWSIIVLQADGEEVVLGLVAHELPLEVACLDDHVARALDADTDARK